MVALEIESFLESQSQQSIGTTLGLLQSYRRKRLWHKIMRLEAKLVGNPLFEHQDVLLCRFECLCSALKMEEAKEFYYRYYSNRQLRQWETCVVLRFLAEAKMWTQAEILFLDFFSNGYRLPNGNAFLLKLCRRFSRHADIIKSIDMLTPNMRPLQYDQLRTLLIDDFLIKNNLYDLDTKSLVHQAKLSNKNAFFYKPTEVNDSEHAVNAGYLCVDKAYFFASLTFLSSFATHRLDIVKLTWFVFLAVDVPEHWADILLTFARKINVNVRVVNEAELLQPVTGADSRAR